MITKQTFDKLYDNLSIILGNLCANDYKQANSGKRRTTKTGRKVHISYSLSDESLEAKETLDLLCKHGESMDLAIEEIIKGYIMRIRLLFPSYLERPAS